MSDYTHQRGQMYRYHLHQLATKVETRLWYVTASIQNGWSKRVFYFVVELKTDVFKPEYVGKLNFYLSAMDDLMRQKEDKPTIGLLLCKYKNDVVVEYALRDVNKPMGIASYQLSKKIHTRNCSFSFYFN